MNIKEKIVGSKGEVLIPKEWREDFHLSGGSHVLLEKTAFMIMIKPKVKHPVKALAELDVRLGDKESHKIVSEIRERIDKDLGL